LRTCERQHRCCLMHWWPGRIPTIASKSMPCWLLVLCAEQLRLHVVCRQMQHKACSRCKYTKVSSTWGTSVCYLLEPHAVTQLASRRSVFHLAWTTATWLTITPSPCLHLRRLQSQHVVVITWAASKLGHFHPALYDRLLWRAVAVRGVLHPQGVAMLLSSCARVGHRPDPRAVAQLLQVGWSCRP
jgi:hypothetical protein